MQPKSISYFCSKSIKVCCNLICLIMLILQSGFLNFDMTEYILDKGHLHGYKKVGDTCAHSKLNEPFDLFFV